MKSFSVIFMKLKSFQEKITVGNLNMTKKDYFGNKLEYDLIDSSKGKVYAKKGDKFNTLIAKELKKDSVKNLFIDADNLIGNFLSKDIFEKKNGIIYFEAGDEISENIIKFLDEKQINEIDILKINSINKDLI